MVKGIEFGGWDIFEDNVYEAERLRAGAELGAQRGILWFYT
jgi:hypothetical protein